MKKIKVLIFISHLVSLIIPIFFTSYVYSVFEPKKIIIQFWFLIFAVFLLSFLLASYGVKQLLNYVFNQTDDVENISFQVSSDIIVRPRGSDRVCCFSLTTLGKKLDLQILTIAPIGVYSEITLGTIRIKKNQIYSICLFSKKYVLNSEFYHHDQTPMSINHYYFDNNLVSFNLKQSDKIKPRLYLVK